MVFKPKNESPRYEETKKVEEDKKEDICMYLIMIR